MKQRKQAQRFLPGDYHPFFNTNTGKEDRRKVQAVVNDGQTVALYFRTTVKSCPKGFFHMTLRPADLVRWEASKK